MMLAIHFALQLLRSTLPYRLAVAHNWWPPRDKAQWLANIAVALAATYFASLTYRLNRSRGTPILVLEHEGKDSTYIHNIGQGPAVNTFFTDSSDEVISFVGAISGGGRVPLPPKLTLDSDRFRLYYHDVQRGIFGRRLWTRTTLHSKTFDFGHRTEPLIMDHAHRIWLPPWTVLRQVHSPTPWEYVQRVGRWYDPRNWRRMFKDWWLPWYRDTKRWIDARRQSPLHARFVSEFEDFPKDKPLDEVKVDWDILFDGLAGQCNGKGMFRLDQVGCRRLDDGGIVCSVKLDIFGKGWLKGLVYIPGSTIAGLAATKEELSSRVFEAFRKYYCRWRPRTTFVCEIRIRGSRRLLPPTPKT